LNYTEHNIYGKLIYRTYSGSNYDDSDTRTGLTLNGLGSFNICLKVIVETIELDNKKKFVQGL
jgi:hypothetical protein